MPQPSAIRLARRRLISPRIADADDLDPLQPARRPHPDLVADARAQQGERDWRADADLVLCHAGLVHADDGDGHLLVALGQIGDGRAKRTRGRVRSGRWGPRPRRVPAAGRGSGGGGRSRAGGACPPYSPRSRCGRRCPRPMRRPRRPGGARPGGPQAPSVGVHGLRASCRTCPQAAAAARPHHRPKPSPLLRCPSRPPRHDAELGRPPAICPRNRPPSYPGFSVCLTLPRGQAGGFPLCCLAYGQAGGACPAI